MDKPDGLTVILPANVSQFIEILPIQMRKAGMRGETITLKLKHVDFKQVTRSTTSTASTQSSKMIYRQAVSLLDNYTTTKKIRLIGVSVSGLSSISAPVQLDLFDSQTAAAETWEKVDRTVEHITQKFGRNATRRAALREEQF